MRDKVLCSILMSSSVIRLDQGRKSLLELVEEDWKQSLEIQVHLRASDRFNGGRKKLTSEGERVAT